MGCNAFIPTHIKCEPEPEKRAARVWFESNPSPDDWVLKQLELNKDYYKNTVSDLYGSWPIYETAKPMNMTNECTRQYREADPSPAMFADVLLEMGKKQVNLEGMNMSNVSTIERQEREIKELRDKAARNHSEFIGQEALLRDSRQHASNQAVEIARLRTKLSDIRKKAENSIKSDSYASRGTIARQILRIISRS